MSFVLIRELSVVFMFLDLRKHDVAFLLTVRPTSRIGTRYNPNEPFVPQVGLVYVRGCEVEGMLDEAGKVIEEGFCSAFCELKISFQEQYIYVAFVPSTSITPLDYPPQTASHKRQWRKSVLHLASLYLPNSLWRFINFVSLLLHKRVMAMMLHHIVS